MGIASRPKVSYIRMKCMRRSNSISILQQDYRRSVRGLDIIGPRFEPDGCRIGMALLVRYFRSSYSFRDLDSGQLQPDYTERQQEQGNASCRAQRCVWSTSSCNL